MTELEGGCLTRKPLTIEECIRINDAGGELEQALKQGTGLCLEQLVERAIRNALAE